jgi:TolB-like protein/class 3 adenylate cyclase/Flp pilus assembly protein TadD
MVEHRPSSKLAVILHADIAGSTALVQQDEHLAHERIQDTFQRFSNTIAQYQGHVRELRGDALLAEFDRASAAVTATLAFQADQADHNAQLSDTTQPTVRVGIAMGEVVIADDTITGAGVVLAQRVEQLAEPGGVCITGAIHEALPQRLPFNRESLGEQHVKGFDEPVRVYTVRLQDGAELPEPPRVSETRKVPVTRWVMLVTAIALTVGGGLLVWYQPWAPEFAPALVEKMAFPLPNKPSIAVLPFDNYSDEEKLDFFADGLTENITSALSKAPGLFVIARNSAATYKGNPVNVKKVAEDLGVQYVLEGSVQKAGDELRVTTQLVDALSGKHLWAGRFDRKASDVFAVQDEITKRVLTELQVELTMGDSARVLSHGTENLDAWLLQLEGYSEMNKWTKESLVRARELYAAAYEADPNWAWPLAGTALTYWFDAKQGWNEARDESIRLGFEFSERAVEIDPNSPLGQYALGNMYFLTNQPERGTELQRKAIELAPNDFSMVAGMAMRIKDFGQEKEAIELFEHAMRLSPKHPWWVPFGYGLALHLVGRKENAVQTYKKAIDLGAKNARTYARLAAVYVNMGRVDDAKATIEEALRLQPNYTVSNYEKAYPLHDPERNAWYKDLLLRSGLPEHPPLPLPDKPSIAVLPFDAYSDDPKQKHFAAGLTDDLTTTLSKVPDIFVVARTSTQIYKGKDVDIREVAKEQGVRYVLEGSIQTSGDKIRINAQLVDGTNGQHVWAETYDRPATDFFAIQDDIVQQVGIQMQVNLTEGDHARIVGGETKSLKAWLLRNEARAAGNAWTREGFVRARELYQAAHEADPTWGRALAGLAWVSWGEAWRNFSKNREESIKEGVAYAEKAIELDPESPIGYAMLGSLMALKGDWDRTIALREKAVELAPNDFPMLVGLAGWLTWADDEERSMVGSAWQWLGVAFGWPTRGSNQTL